MQGLQGRGSGAVAESGEWSWHHWCCSCERPLSCPAGLGGSWLPRQAQLSFILELDLALDRSFCSC